MEPSDLVTSPRGRREPPCAIYGLGSCPYPVALRRMVLSSPSPREGGEEGVTAAEGEDEDEPVEVILVLDSPPRLAYKQTGEDLNRPKGETHRNPNTIDRGQGS
jgi:hypothetical protein